MYSVSSQRKFWTFNSKEEIAELRLKQNQEFINRHGANMDEKERLEFFLTPEEERLLLRNYELNMREFCRRFEPSMPKCIVGTAFHYFKRFYLNNSAMDYHPKEILATCVYLSCKTEEFNVSISQFVANIRGDRVKAMDIILSNELLLMQQLNYYLTVHNPFRPIEGFLIDIKTRCDVKSPERFRPAIDEFIERTLLTDVCLLYAPSQLALAAVLHAASKEQENLDQYVTEQLFNNVREKLAVLIGAVRRIRSMAKDIEPPSKDRIKILEKKLEGCRNQENNPDSQIYKLKQKRLLEEEDEVELGYAPQADTATASSDSNHNSSVGDVSMLSTTQ